MKEALDRLAKDLAGGMSRREAFKRFGSGFAIAMAGLFGARSSRADGNDACRDWCSAHHPGNEYQVCDPYFTGDANSPGTGGQGRAFGECMSMSSQCPPGECAMVCYGTWICVSAY